MEEVVLKASIDLGGDGAKSLKQLKQEFKETQKELDGLQQGSEKYVATLRKLGGIKDEIGDLNDEIKSFNPEGKVKAFGDVVTGLASGFQAATGAAALFGSESKELEKALLKVQAVMLFTEGIKGIVAMGDAFKRLGNVVKDYALQVLGAETVTKVVTVATRIWNAVLNASPITIMVTAIATLVAGVYALSKALSSNKSEVEVLAEEYENLKKKNEELNHQLDNEIKLLESLGGHEQEIIDKKREKLALIQQEAEASAKLSKQRLAQAIEETSLLEGINRLFGNAGAAAGAKAEAILKANEEVKKSNQELEDATNEINVFENNIERERAEKAKKAHEEAIKQKKDELAEHKKYLDAKADADNAEADRYVQLQKETKEAIRVMEAEFKAQEQAIADANFEKSQTEFYASIELKAEQNAFNLEAQLAYLEAQKQQELANTELTESERLLIKQDYAERERILKVNSINTEVQIAEAGINAVKGLSDLYFAGQLAKAKGNAAQELAIKKKQFNVDKGINIAKATIDGIRSVQAGLTMAPPVGYVLAAINGALAIANIAKIASQKFDGGGGGSAAASIPSPASIEAPAINAPENSSTLLNPDGSVQQNNNNAPPTVKAIVVETDIRQTTNRVNAVEEQATIR